MIVYDRLWAYIEREEISQYKLQKEGISHSTLTRLKRNQPVSTDTLDKLSTFLDCNIEDIIEHK